MSGRGTLRWLGLMIVGFVLIRPVSVLAQTIKRADLVGTWLEVSSKHRADRRDPQQVVETFLTLQSDSTWQKRVKENGVERQLPTGQGRGRWDLVGDSLWFFDPTVFDPLLHGAAPGSVTDTNAFIWFNRNIAANKVSFRGGQLFIGKNRGRDWSFDQQEFECRAQAYRRIDPSKPLPVSTLPPPPLTVKRADLVGTWVATVPKNDPRAGQVDTLTLGADSTWRRVWTGRTMAVDDPVPFIVSGRWYLLPGDTLWLMKKNEESKFPGTYDGYSTGKVTLEGQQFSLQERCEKPWAYKRIKP